MFVRLRINGEWKRKDGGLESVIVRVHGDEGDVHGVLQLAVSRCESKLRGGERERQAQLAVGSGPDWRDVQAETDASRVERAVGGLIKQFARHFARQVGLR